MAGQTRRKSRVSSRRKVMPAVTPGELTGNDEVGWKTDAYGSQWAHRFMGKINQLCEFSRAKPMPPFRKDTRRLDRWLQDSLDDERTNFLAAFVDQASMIQANRPYRLIGGKALVSRTLDLLHMSEGGEGFRKLLKLTAINYYTSNFGGAVYMNRVEPVQPTYLPSIQAWDWQLPVVNQLFATDPTLFSPRDDYVYPYEYDSVPWTRYDYFKITSMPSTLTSTWGVGRSALYRCIQIAKMTSAIYEYIYDLVSPDTAKGIVTIKGMSWDEFLSAMAGSEAVNEQDQTKTNGFLPGDDLGDILVLADRENEIDVRFVTLGRLPEGFFLDQWIRWTLTSFATNLGFPLEEFIGMPSSRLLGQSSAEIDAGERRGGTKGGAEFINSLQEQMQQLVVPSTVHFEFSERDTGAETFQTNIDQKRVEMVVDLFTATQLIELDEGEEIEREARRQSQKIINSEEARRLLVEWGVLPEWIASGTTDFTVDDGFGSAEQARLREWRDMARETQAVQRLSYRPLSEPVVMYDQFVDQATGLVSEREVVLWDDDNDLTRHVAWSGYRPDTNTFRTASMAQDWGEQNRNLKRKPRLEAALKSDHVDGIARIVRRYLLDGQPISRDNKEALSSRLYAITQVGRDNIIGRDRLQETAIAEIAGQLVSWAAAYTKRLAHLDMQPDADVLDEIADERDAPAEQSVDIKPLDAGPRTLQSQRRDLEQSVRVWAEPADFDEAYTSEVKATARELAKDMTCRAFAAGQYAAANFVGSTEKTMLANCQTHLSLDGTTVPIDDMFVPGMFWGGMLPSCRCEVKVPPKKR